jgi:hypothetical protein
MFWKMFILLDKICRITDVCDMVKPITISKSQKKIFLGNEEDEYLERVL